LSEHLRTLTRDQRWDDLPTVLTDTILDALVTCGRYDQIPDLLHAKFDGIADGIVLPPLGDPREDHLLESCVSELKADSPRLPLGTHRQ
jgi:hypothetical protein